MEFLILLIVALVISSIGFKKFVWFISIGYGFSITGLGITMLWMFRNQLTLVTVILSVLCIIWGKTWWISVGERKKECILPKNHEG